MIALISDIHGNFEALKAVLDAIDGMKIEKIFCLGDVLGYYPQVNECCAELRNRNVECILGNHDWYMISNTSCPRSKSANDCLQYQRRVIDPGHLRWIASFPVIRIVDDLALVHGGWNDPLDEYLYEPAEDYFDSISNTYFASGHTHKQVKKKFENKAYCNPGSVGQPRDGNPKAAFATFNGKDFNLHRVDYDISRVCELMQELGFNEYYYKRLKTGAQHFG
jgi:predicted phosphodiesterase